MNLKLVYRALRKISDWTVYGFYSEVYVEGTENVPNDGPIIIASNHANEIIDVATLAVTIPQRRHVSFWAKSTLFTNPVFRSILSSSGAIPVQRNPNRDDGSSKAALFRSSSIALASGKVIAVFSEGASYTEPTIVQVLSGTAWAAVEYTRWRRKEHDAGKDVVIVPVGLVYTDKATFDSGLRVQYGTPIRMSDYVEELFDVPPGANPDDVAYRVVQKVTQRIEQQLFAMTINASDWETLYAAETLRAIVAPQLVLKDWVSVSQQLVDLLSDPAPSSPLGRAKESLIKYYSLLHYTSLSHSDLVSLPSCVSRIHYIMELALPSLSTIILAPFYAPALLLHLPACVAAELMLKVLSIREEPEGFGQYRAVGGGFGAGVAAAALLWHGRLMEWVSSQPRGWVGSCLSYLAVGWIIVRCYARLAPGLHRRLKRALVSYRILLGVLSPRDPGLDVGPYTKLPPPPPSNAFIRRHGRTSSEFWDKREKEGNREAPPPVAGRKLVRAVLEQREETERVVKSVLEEVGLRNLDL
ncbi:hypothetical protein BDZ89DRAFT_1016948 [Hymenopellis radicata]|nr:hypothetical protein BDZ89DRAFT_1016948 [Hymenopellis radicata]